MKKKKNKGGKRRKNLKGKFKNLKGKERSSILTKYKGARQKESGGNKTMIMKSDDLSFYKPL